MSSATSSESWHTSLQNPAAHIRLISFSAEHAEFEEDGEIDCIMLTCVLSKAPQYVAISYTWGQPALTRHIIINGRRVPVRENCYYALWQAQHQRCDYIWIDALCVDQYNLDEKSEQVAMMGRIYERAENVLVSLGPHVPESRFLANHLETYEFIVPGMSQWGDWKTDIQRAESELGSDHLLKLMNALVWLVSHPYWTRVWIVQEFVMARTADVRCGEDILDLNTIYAYHQNLLARHSYVDKSAELGHRLVSELASFSQDDKLRDSPLNILMPKRGALTAKRWRNIPRPVISSGGRYKTVSSQRQSQIARNYLDEHNISADLDLRNVLEFRGNDCLNPLDRIYGFAHLMAETKHPITTNYRTSNFDLALECLNNVRHDALLWARRIFGALCVPSTQPEIQAILDVRRERFLRPCEEKDLESATDKGKYLPWRDVSDSRIADKTRFRKGFSLYFFNESHFVRIQRTSEDRLTGNLTQNRPENHDVEEFEKVASARASAFAEAWAGQEKAREEAEVPVELFEDEIVVGLLSCRAKCDDYILQSEDEVICGGNAFHVCLIVRQHAGLYFEIIGQGLVSSDWSFCPGGDECDCRMFDLHSARDEDRDWYGSDGLRIEGFEVRLSKDDLIAFAAQDLTGDKIGTKVMSNPHEGVVDLPLEPRDPWAPLRRVYTNITSRRFSSYAVCHSSSLFEPTSSSSAESDHSNGSGSSGHFDPSIEFRLMSRWRRKRAKDTSRRYDRAALSDLTDSDSPRLSDREDQLKPRNRRERKNVLDEQDHRELNVPFPPPPASDDGDEGLESGILGNTAIATSSRSERRKRSSPRDLIDSDPGDLSDRKDEIRRASLRERENSKAKFTNRARRRSPSVSASANSDSTVEIDSEGNRTNSRKLQYERRIREQRRIDGHRERQLEGKERRRKPLQGNLLRALRYV